MGNLTSSIILWLGALIFIAVGIYAVKREKPMWLWGGSAVPESMVKDVKAYNRAIGKMWLACSVPLLISGVAVLIFPGISLIIFALVCVAGIGVLAWCYHKIEEKYFVK